MQRAKSCHKLRITSPWLVAQWQLQRLRVVVGAAGAGLSPKQPAQAAAVAGASLSTHVQGAV